MLASFWIDFRITILLENEGDGSVLVCRFSDGFNLNQIYMHWFMLTWLSLFNACRCGCSELVRS